MELPGIEKQEDGSFLIKGELNMHTVSALLRETEALFAGVSGDLFIDLGRVTRADSAGLALLIEWLRLARRQNLTISYRNLPAQLLQIAHVSELQDVLPIQD